MWCEFDLNPTGDPRCMFTTDLASRTEGCPRAVDLQGHEPPHRDPADQSQE